MSNKLLNIIKQHIQTSGPMDVATFMDYCLTHPEYGYYTSKKESGRDPFGVTGDFVTAPEISQLFGEMVGVFIRNFYEQMDSPPDIHLVECGAGRGTMMRDILRVISPHINVSIHIIEVSRTLREIQKQTIGRDDISWHDNFETIPHDAPLIVVGNEFLDAIPIHQAINVNDNWFEHCIGLVNDELNFVQGAPLIAKNLPDPRGRKIYEFSPRRESIHLNICERIKSQKGLLLWIDYGFEHGENKASLQAIKAHKHVDVLYDLGMCDLTSLVDFESLVDVTPDGLVISDIATQSEFLKYCGIDVRCKNLCKQNPQDSDTILSGYHRLIDHDQMGSLFKVLAVSKI